MPGTTKSEGALFERPSYLCQMFLQCDAIVSDAHHTLQDLLQKEGAAVRMTWAEMTLQSVKDLRPCSRFDRCGDRMPRRQRHAESIGSRHEVSGWQSSKSSLHTLLKGLEIVMVSQAQLAACSGEMQQDCGQ